MTGTTPHYSVAIIGGGATGTMIAYHLLRQRPDLATGAVAIIEPRAQLGAGLAYGTQDRQHRINVPAARMSLDTAKPDDFRAWLDLDALAATDPDAFLPSGDLYPARAQFGQYLAARIAPFLETGHLSHQRAAVTGISRENGLWQLKLSEGGRLTAGLVVIALTHSAPALPAPLRDVAQDTRLIANPWRDDALSRIAPDDRVAIIGTGLTMADVVASLAARGHNGSILAFSRRGLRPRAHAAEASALSDILRIAPSPTALGLLRAVRGALRHHPDLSWHEIIDATRKQGRGLWAALDVTQRRRLIRHLRPFWDVHRFRIAPQIDAILTKGLNEKRLVIRAARLTGARSTPPGLVLELQNRRGHDEAVTVDHVINTTGPDHAGIISATSFLRDLEALGAIAPDPTGLGLHTGHDHHALPAHNTRHNDATGATLLVAGPLSRGTFGELMGLPEVTENAQSVAARLSALLHPETQYLADEARS